MDIGIRELKRRLSHYIERAADGDVIRVTDRGHPKALLGPLPGMSRFEQGIREGWIRAGNGELPARSRRRVHVARTIEEMLAEDRGT